MKAEDDEEDDEDIARLLEDCLEGDKDLFEASTMLKDGTFDEIEKCVNLLKQSSPAAAELPSCFFTNAHGDLLERNAEFLYRKVMNSYGKVSHFEGLHYY